MIQQQIICDLILENQPSYHIWYFAILNIQATVDPSC